MRFNKSFQSVIADMVKVLKYLSNPLNKQDYETMTQRTGVPKVQIRRFIEPVCMEHREITKRHLRTYSHALKNENGEKMMCGAMKKQVLHMDTGIVDVNMSKWEAFKSVADEYGYLVKRATEEEAKDTDKKIFVTKKMPENQTVYFSSFHVNYDDLSTYEWLYCPVDGWINDYEFIRERTQDRTLCPHCSRTLIKGDSADAKVEYYEV